MYDVILVHIGENESYQLFDPKIIIIIFNNYFNYYYYYNINFPTGHLTPRANGHLSP